MRAPKLLNAEALLNYALRLLSGRAHSLGELREKCGGGLKIPAI